MTESQHHNDHPPLGRRRRLRHHGPRPHAVVAWFAFVLVFLAITLVAAGAASAVAVTAHWLQNLPDYTSPDAFDVAQATKVYSADGKLLAMLYLQNREVVPISQMATSLVDGVVAVEDERYFQHGGVDPVGILRAVVSDFSGGRQGASTITQQYIRNTILANEATQRTLKRKVREAFLAMELEKRYSKQQILEDYLNTIYFGEGAYGAEAAAEEYYAKHASQLTLPEGAMIAGLAQSPGRLSPRDNPTGALQRRNVVLQRMLANGYITQADYAAAIAAPLGLKQAARPPDGIYYAPYFVTYVKSLLQQQFPPKLVFEGGLTVYTTLDSHLQALAEKSAHKRFNGRSDPEVALVAINPNNGHVLAMVGGRSFAKSKFNLATQAYRQPGSSFKTFTLVTALSEGMPPNFLVDSSSPAYIPAPGKDWRVNNDEGQGSGLMPLDEATWYSVNCVYARVAYTVGIKNVTRTANRMGITATLPSYPSVALGSVGVPPLQMASAYGTLATGGVHHDPIVVDKVVDREGRIIFESHDQGTRAVRASVAHATVDVLKGVLTQGTAAGKGIGRPAAGKTGTSQFNRDCWFVGFTPQLVTAVWVGYPKTEKTVVVDGSKGFGGTVAAPIWSRFMRAALIGKAVKDFPYAPDPSYDPAKFDLSAISTYTSVNPPSSSNNNPPSNPAPSNPTPRRSTPRKHRSSGGGSSTGGGGSSGGGGGGSTNSTSGP